jgi:hypothetical protein
MANIDSDVTVNVYSGGSAVSAQGFNLLVVSSGVTFPGEYVREYTDTQGMLDDTYVDDGTYDAVSTYFFGQDVHPQKVKIGKVTDFSSLSTDLDAIKTEDDDFYYVVCLDYDQVDATNTACAAWCAANDRMAGIQSSSSDILANTPGNVFGAIKALNNGSTYMVYHDDDHLFAALAWAAYKTALDPDDGSTTWDKIELTGVDASEGAATVMTAAEYANVLANGGNSVVLFKKKAVMSPGKLADGTFIDAKISRDWAKARIGEAVAQLFIDASARNEKIPYNSVGIAQIEQVVAKTLANGAPPKMPKKNSHFDEGSIWTKAPSMDDVTTAQVAARQLPAVRAGADISGAIQSVTFNIYLPEA